MLLLPVKAKLRKMVSWDFEQGMSSLRAGHGAYYIQMWGLVRSSLAGQDGPISQVTSSLASQVLSLWHTAVLLGLLFPLGTAVHLYLKYTSLSSGGVCVHGISVLLPSVCLVARKRDRGTL